MSQSGSFKNQTGPGSGIVRTLTGNSGGPVPPDFVGNIDVVGSGGITVSGNPGTNTLTINDGGSASNFVEDVGFANPIAGTLNIVGDNNITTAGDTLNTVTVELTQGNDGQVLIGATGLNAAWANLTSTGASITITNGPNTINLEAAASGTTTFDTDSGTATPLAGVIDIAGGLNINTAGATNVVTINLDNSINLPDTNIGFTSGTLLLNSVPFLHNFGGTGGGGGGSQNTFLGDSSGNDTLSTGGNNTGIGADSLPDIDTGSQNTAVGVAALQFTVSGSFNTSVGYLSSTQVNGNNNTAVGAESLAGAASAGTDNTVVGFSAGDSITTLGSFNTAIGSNALATSGAGFYNVAVGYNSGSALADSSSDSNILISNVGVASDSNTIRIGTQGTGNGQQDLCYIAGIFGVPIGTPNEVVIIDNTGNLGSSSGTDGQVLISATAGSPAWANLTSSGSTITITNGANTINLETGSSVAASFTTDSGTATPSSGVIDIKGGLNMNTSGATNVVTINLDNVYSTAVGATNKVVLVDNTGVIGGSTGSDGQVLIGATGASPAWSTLTQGSNITITNAANSITIAATSSSMAWTDVTTASVALVSGNGYIMNRSSVITGTLPASSVEGDLIAIVGKGTGGWIVAEGTGQNIHFGSSTTTTTTGTLASTLQYDCIEMVCIVANTTWVVRSSVGNITVT